jgi:branched-chain amino acid transport system substrate-binding protein
MTGKKHLFVCAALAVLSVMPVLAAETVKIGAIFSITGGNANLGLPESRTLQMLVDAANAAGGIGGMPVKLIMKDSQGDAEKATSFAKQLIDEEQVLAIIGPSTSGESMKLKGLCDEAETILLSCAAAETIVNPVAKWVFKVAPMDSFVAQMIFATMRKMGISRIGVMCSNSGFGVGGKAQLQKYAPSAGIQILIAEDYDKEATDLTSVLTKIKALNVQALVNWSTEPAQSIVLKNMKQLSFDVPVFQSHGFANIAYVNAAGKAAEGTIFPAGRILVTETLPTDNPQKKQLVSYRSTYMAKFGEEPSTFGGHAWDAFSMLADAVSKVGADRNRVRDYIEGIKGFVGISGIFSFSPADHNGLTMDALEMLTVKNGRFVPLGK